jgi:putative transposase
MPLAGQAALDISVKAFVLRERGQSGERRAQAIHPARKKPELMADGPDPVWSRDITKLKGPARRIYFQLVLPVT